MEHRRAETLMAMAIDFPLASSDAAELAEHRRGCPTCVAAERELWHDAAALRAMPVLDAPIAIREALAWSASGNNEARGGVSRPLLLVAALLLTAAAFGAAVAGGLLNLRDLSLLPDTEPSATATESQVPVSQAPSASASPSSEPSATPRTGQLAVGSWAVVATDALNLRTGPSTDAPVLGTAVHGQLVQVTGPATVVSDTSWYPVGVVAGSARSGWMADRQGAEVLLEPATGTVAQAWCGRVEAETTEYNSPNFGVRILGIVRFAGLQIASDRLEPGMAGALSVAWGADAEICMLLTVTNAELASIAVPNLDIEACGIGGLGAQNELILGVGDEGVSPSGETSGRSIWLHEALLGFEPYGSNDLPNFARTLLLSAFGDVPACISVQASGSLGSTSVNVEITTTDCVTVQNRSSSELILAHVSLQYGAGQALQFDIVPKSEVGPEFVPGTVLGASIRAGGGPAGVIFVEAVALPDCGGGGG